MTDEVKRGEIRALTEEEFVKMWANSTWAKSTFKFLAREGLQIMKATEPVMVSQVAINVAHYYREKHTPEEYVEAVLDAAGVKYV